MRGHEEQSGVVTAYGLGWSGLGGERTGQQGLQTALNPAECPGFCPGGVEAESSTEGRFSFSSCQALGRWKCQNGSMDTESPGQGWARAGWLWKSDPFLGLDSWGLRKGERETVFAQKKKNQAAEGTCARRTKLAFCCEKI